MRKPTDGKAGASSVKFGIRSPMHGFEAKTSFTKPKLSMAQGTITSHSTKAAPVQSPNKSKASK